MLRASVVKGTRIAAEPVIDLRGRGCTTAQMLGHYDHLPAEDVQACLPYAAEALQFMKVYPLPC